MIRVRFRIRIRFRVRIRVKDRVSIGMVFSISSSQCSTTGVTKTVVCAILSVGWCI